MSNLAHKLLHSLGAGRDLRTADTLPRPLSAPAWNFAYLAGKLVELRGRGASAVLTAGLDLVRKAQEASETTVWVTSTESVFFPIDAMEGGVDLDALAVVRVSGAAAILGAADKLVRSGAFGLIVLDLVSLVPAPEEENGKTQAGPRHVSLSRQSRLLNLAYRNQTAMVFLTSKSVPLSVAGSFVSLRGEARRLRVGEDLYSVEVAVLKDKQQGPGWRHAELCCGPAGLR